MLRYGTPATSPGGEEEDDAAGNRRPTCYDSKELLSDMIERGEPDMQWCERHRCDKQPKEYPQNDKGYPKIFLANTCVISLGHLENSRRRRVRSSNTSPCRRFPSMGRGKEEVWVEAKKRQTPAAAGQRGSQSLGAPWRDVDGAFTDRVGVD